jgi:site-specific DNA-cytosine methylase
MAFGPKDLERQLARMQGRTQRPQEPEPQRQAGVQQTGFDLEAELDRMAADVGFDLEAAIEQIGRQRRAPEPTLPLAPRRHVQPIRSQDLQGAIAELVGQAKRGEVESRPSVLLGLLRDRFPERTAVGKGLRDDPASTLVLLRSRLPNQPQAPLRWPDAKRTVQHEGMIPLALDGWPIAAEGFAGGGLFSLALMLEGIYVHDLCEFDEAAVETMQRNLHDYARSNDANTWSPMVPEGGLDLLTGGPPCQPFSRGRHMGGGEPTQQNYYPRVLEWVADAMPRIVCLENSSEIVKDERFRAFFRWWWAQMGVLGYEGVMWVLLAADFGTPQLRERAFVVAWPKRAPWGDALKSPPETTHARPGTPEVQSKRKLPWTRAFDRLRSGCCAGWGLTDCVNLGNLEGLCSTCVEGTNFDPAPNLGGESGRIALSQKDVARSAAFYDEKRLRIEVTRPIPGAQVEAWEDLKRNEKRLTRYLSPVIRAGVAKSGPPSGLLELDSTMPWPTVNRDDPESIARYLRQLIVMGVRDAAKLQDVPQWIEFMGTRKQQFRQIGNGIPVNLGRAIARHLRRALHLEPKSPLPIALRGPYEGLWPADAVDPCARYTGLLGYFGVVTPTAKQAITQQQRFARPYTTLQSYREQAPQREFQVQRRDLWSRVVYQEPERYTWEALKGWVPKGKFDAPPGFRDFHEFVGLVQGQEPSLGNHAIRAWMKGVRMSQAQAEAHLGFRLESEEGFPEWSEYA